MAKQRPLREIVTEVAPRPAGRHVSEGEDFSALNRLLAQVRAASAKTAQAPAQAAPKPAADAGKEKKS